MLLGISSVANESLPLPKSLEIDAARRLVTSHYFGVMTKQDVLEQWQLIKKHPEFDPCFTYLTDLTGVTHYAISSAELKHLVETKDPFDSESRRIVVAPTDLLFGMVRMYEMSGGNHPKLTPVRSMQEAVTLLKSE